MHTNAEIAIIDPGHANVRLWQVADDLFSDFAIYDIGVKIILYLFQSHIST